jgi:putative two-component system response regulator
MRELRRDHHRILVVDDEPANVRLLERLLTISGYGNIRSTTDPTEVEDLYLEFRPDLILLDLHMPGLDGFAVMARLGDLIPSDEYLPILVLTADVSVSSKQRALVGGAKDFLAKPLDTSEVLARVANLLETRYLHLQLRRHNELLEDTVRERTAALRDTVGELEKAQNELRLSQEETIHSLSLAAEFRDDATSRHIERMSRYCAIIAGAMGFDDARRDTIRVAAKMHDVGKIGIPDAILLKPGRLTHEEFDMMKAHAQIGYEILSGSTSEIARTAATIAWSHHEKVDGSGYPRGLVGDEIPVDGRIATVADVFDALTTDRVYRKAYSLPESLTIMKEQRGVHFDEEILGVFLDRMDEILAMKQKLDEAVV